MSSADRRRRVRHTLVFAFALVLLTAPTAIAQSYTVTSLADSGAGSLRAAIDSANGDGVPTTIDFAPGLAGGTIALASPLPALTEPQTTIDGDLDDDCDPDIALDGSASPGDLNVYAPQVTLRGLALYGGNVGIWLVSTLGVVECSYLGANLAGDPGPGNLVGIAIQGSGGNRVGPGNVIAYNSQDGIQILEFSGPGYPDFLGSTPDLTSVFPTIDFIDDCDALATVGGGTIYDTGGHPFIENVGMRLTGTVYVSQAGSYSFTLEDVDDNARLTVAGVELIDASSPGTWSASADLSGGETVRLDYFEGCGPGSVRLTVSGPGTATLATDGNLSACPTGQLGLCGDLFQLRTPNEGNTVSQNAIFANGQTGIALNACCDVTPNDPGDADIGANTLLNYPEITSVLPIGGGLYSASGSAPPDSTVEVFVADGDPSGFGEGREFLASTTADGGGAFSVGLPLALGTSWLTATATDAAGNTSEFGPNFAPTAGMDRVTLGAGLSGLPGESIDIPVYVRDASLTPLGLDRPAGERIQGIVFKVFFPSSTVVAASAARDGVLLGLNALYELAPATAGSIAYLASFAEASDPIPFTLDAADPGDLVARLTLTLAPNAPAGPVNLFLDSATTELSNQAGTLDEHVGNGNLQIVHAQLFVGVNSAWDLVATPESSGSIRLRWADPNANETGFRVERSEDGASWSPVGSAGPDDWQFLDTAGLAPGTLYHYRLVTLIALGDSQISSRATASTFPAVAAKVCATRLSPPRSWARFPSAVWNGTSWSVAWNGREGAYQEDVYFQRFAATTLAPLGPPLRVNASDASAAAFNFRMGRPTLVWNGTHHGVVWPEFLPGEPGIPTERTIFFALLDAAGNKLRGDVRIATGITQHAFEAELPLTLAWDGTHWGFFSLEVDSPPMQDLVYRRFNEQGDLVTGPVVVASSALGSVSDVRVAWNDVTSKYGVAWQEIHDTTNELFFRPVEETTGAVEGSLVTLSSFEGFYGTYGHSVVADGSGWAVAWSEQPPDFTAVAWLNRLDSTGAPSGAAVRLSEDPPAEPSDANPLLAAKPGGGFAVFVTCAATAAEICRLETDAAGNRLGTPTLMTPDDGRGSSWSALAANGSELLLAWNEQSSGSLELGGLLVAASDGAPPGAVEILTSGHEPGTTQGVPGLTGFSVVPLASGGFVAVWLDTLTGSNLIQAKIWDASGTEVANLSPLLPDPAYRPAVVAVGDEFAVAWNSRTTWDVQFMRFDALGNPIVGPVSVSTAPVNSTPALAFSGEAYGLVWARPGGLNFLRVAPDGTLLGSELLIPVGATFGSPGPQLEWGGNWAVVWAGPGRTLHFGLLDDAGNLQVSSTLDANVENFNQFHLLATGNQLGLAWSERRGYLDPPLEEIRFTTLDWNGSVLLPDLVVVSGPTSDRNPRLYWADGTYHLLHQFGGTAGIREIEIAPDGTILPGERRWDHRGYLAGAAYNGVTLGLAFSTESDYFFETGACLADASPPPCPNLSAASVDNRVQLTWDPPSDPESGIFRYHLYRDGLGLAEIFPPATQFDDGGYTVGSTHVYQVRALNGAFDESDACPTLAFSTTAGDANGDGVLDPADVFYLVNFLLADGPPPLGDADANGDGAVTVTDIFYLINFHFAGGPPPVPIAGDGVQLVASEPYRSTEIELAALPGPQVRSRLVLGSATAAPGSTIRLPIDLVDRPGTPLGPEQPFGDRVQALALAVACSPCDGIAALALEPAGALARFEPLFASFPARPGHAALVAAYDELDAPLFAGTDLGHDRARVATLVVQLAPSAVPGTTLELRLDPGTTLLANQAGTTYENVPNGWLELADGRLTVGAKHDLDRP